MGKGVAFGNLSFPGILKCLGCRMPVPDILQAGLVRRISSDGYFLLLSDIPFFFGFLPIIP